MMMYTTKAKYTFSHSSVLPVTNWGRASMIKLRDEVSSEAGSPLTPTEKEEADDDKKSCHSVFVCGVCV